ncbi:unnamed protein product [Oreochromis niloticus]|nr:unnamed protein product [Mustela putorius furo]
MMTDDDGSSSRSPLPPVEFIIDLNLLFPRSSLSPNFIDLFRGYVRNVSFPQNITVSLTLEDLNFTTWCYPNSTGGLQCQCEDQFAWSCDKCGLYGACSNVTSQTCKCIKGLPPGGEFCEPITSISTCPITTPGMTNILVIYAFIHLFFAGIQYNQLFLY